MLKLNNCTAVCIDTENHELASRAARRCQEACEFADIFVLSDRQLDVKTKIIDNIPSIKLYSDFVLCELINHIETDHVLIFQWDGFVLNPGAWRQDFLSYDYIGAPWPAGLFARNDVGNGGFSLRSRRLLELTATIPRQDGLFEDVIIANEIARTQKIDIAPLALAREFSFEFIPVNIPTFGFHGHFNFIKIMDEEELVSVLHAAPNSFWEGEKPLRWIEDAWKSGRPDLAKYLYSYCRAEFADLTADWPSLSFDHLRSIPSSSGRMEESPIAAPPGAQAGRQALIVLGMHRSGTSVLTKLINSMGAAAPLNLIAPDGQNADGYWESRAVVEANDALLVKAGTSWDAWRQIGECDLGVVTLNAFVTDAAAIIDDEFGSAPLIAVKDPRISRLYELWDRAVSLAGYDPLPIIMVRAPQEVALSLHVRDGIAIDRGLLIWLRYNLDAEMRTRGRTRCVVTYDALHLDANSVARQISETLCVTWPSAQEDDREAQPIFSEDLRHHRIGSEKTDTSGLIADIAGRAYMAMLDLTSDPCAAAPQRVLDEIRIEFDGVMAFLGDAIKDGEHSLRQELHREKFITAEYVRHSEIIDRHLAEARAQRDEHVQSVAELSGQAVVFQQHIAEARAQRDEQSARAVMAENTTDELHRQVIDAKSRTCDDAAQIAALIVHGAQLDRDLAEARAQRDDHVHVASQLRAQASALESELADLRELARKGVKKRSGGSRKGASKATP